MGFNFTIESDGSRSSKTRLGKHELRFDMPRSLGGEGKGPGPLAYFVASAAACFHYYASGEVLKAGLDVTELEVRVHSKMEEGERKRVESLRFSIRLPRGAQQATHDAVIHAVRTCPVYNALVLPPTLEIDTLDATTE
jgi:uncharacterized OsmC-like protein